MLIITGYIVHEHSIVIQDDEGNVLKEEKIIDVEIDQCHCLDQGREKMMKI